MQSRKTVNVQVPQRYPVHAACRLQEKKAGSPPGDGIPALPFTNKQLCTIRLPVLQTPAHRLNQRKESFQLLRGCRLTAVFGPLEQPQQLGKFLL